MSIRYFDNANILLHSPAYFFNKHHFVLAKPEGKSSNYQPPSSLRIRKSLKSFKDFRLFWFEVILCGSMHSRNLTISRFS